MEKYKQRKILSFVQKSILRYYRQSGCPLGREPWHIVGNISRVVSLAPTTAGNIINHRLLSSSSNWLWFFSCFTHMSPTYGYPFCIQFPIIRIFISLYTTNQYRKSNFVGTRLRCERRNELLLLRNIFMNAM